MQNELDTAGKKESTSEVVEGVDAGTQETEGFDFTDTTTSDENKSAESSSQSGKEVQTKEQNQEFARKRREQEKQALIKKTREQAIIDALDGINPFTGEAMTDSTDVDEYLTMKEIEKSGGDPVNDYRAKSKEKQKEVIAKQAQEQQQNDWFKKDRDAFVEKFPDVKVEELIQNKKFSLFCRGKVGSVPLAELYEGFQELEKTYQTEAELKVSQQVANRAATPGSLSTDKTATAKSYSDMSSEEIDAIVERVKRGEKIT